MVSNSASDDGSTEVSSSLGLFYHVPLINLELGQTEISLAIDKKENKCKKWKECTHTKLLLQLLHSLNLLHSPHAAAFSSKLVAFSSAFAAAHCSSSPNDASTGLVQCLAICPRIPYLLHLRCFFMRPSSPALILFFHGLPGGLVSTGEHSLNPGSTMFHWSFPKSAGTFSA